MLKAPTPLNEKERLSKLKSYQILDTPPEMDFDDITELAARICATKISLVTLVDSERQWIKASYGLAIDQTPRDISYCGHTINQDDVFVVEDAGQDERFRDNPLFLNRPHVRFYAGVPLKTPEGFNVGALCVIDSEARTIDAAQKNLLKTLARNLVYLLERKKYNRTHGFSFGQEESAYLKGLETHAVVVKADAQGKVTYVNQNFCQITGYSLAEIAGSSYQKLCLSNYSENFYLEIWKSLGAARPWRGEILNNAKDGSVYWMEVTLTPSISSSGELEGLIAIQYDITKRKKTEKSLKESELRHRLLFDQSIDPVMTLSGPEWKFTSGNKAALKFFGVADEAAFTKLSPWELSPEYQPDGELSAVVAASRIEEALETGSSFFEWIHCKTDGTVIPSTIALSKITQDNRIYLHAIVRDISEQKQIEQALLDSREALLKSKEYLDLAIEGANLGIWDWDLRTNQVYYSEKWAQLRGIKSQELKMTFEDWESRVHPDDALRAMETIQHYLQGKINSYELVCRSRHASGKWVYIISRGRFSEWDENGRAVRMTGIEFDLTEYRSNQHKLELFFSRAPYGIAFCGADGSFLTINQEFVIITGYQKAELNEINLWKIMPAHYAQSIKAQFENVKGDGADRMTTVRFEDKFTRHDGEIIHLEWAISPDMESETLYVAASDVTERRRKEEVQQLVSQARSRFIEFSSDKKKFFDYLLDKLLKATGSHYGFLGEVLEDKQGKFLKTFSLTDISWSAETKDFFLKNAPAGIEFRDLNTLYGEVIKTGETLITNTPADHPSKGGLPPGHPELRVFMGVPIYYGDKFIAMVGVANRPKGYNPEMYNLLKPFFEVIGEMINSLKLNMSLEDQKRIAFHNAKLASIGEMAAGVGHEINNPLAIIAGQLDMTTRLLESKQLLDDEFKKRLNKMDHAVSRISNIVKGLRTFSRSDELEFKDFNFSELVHETVDMIRDMFEKEGITLELRLEHELWIFGNRGRLQQVLINLLNNSRDAMESCPRKLLKVDCFKSAGLLELSVIDSGRGIPQDIKDKIFEPFFTTKDVNEGTGIGLALLNSIVKEHDGEIQLDSEVNVGTRFSILLKPLAYVPVKTAAPKQIVHPALKGLQGKVLIVDDEEGIREVLGDMLASMGLNIQTASSGLAALELVYEQKASFDLIISDMKMPGLDGPGLLQQLTQKGIFNGKFLFITGGVNIELNQLSSLVDGIIPKPFKKQEIFLILSKLLGHG
jgi:PAS domain S-box-containing protein